MDKLKLAMIDEFQCPGCIHGTDPEECPKFELVDDSQGTHCHLFHCKNWRPSTFQAGVGRLCIGLPKGFLRTGMIEFGDAPFTYMRLFLKPEDRPLYNRFNVPVWAMEQDGYLYVRCFCPRNCWVFVDVIKDGKIEMASFKDGPYEHKAINVGEFINEID